MPKVNLKFGRRRSSGNVLDDVAASPSDTPTPAPASSFRVLERPEKIIHLNGGRGPQDQLRQVQRPFNSPLHNLRGKSVEELGLGAGLNRLVDAGTGVTSHWLLKGARGSGGTTNSGSSGYYESSSASARHSSSSTLPSSVDADREPEDDELFPRRSKTSPMYQSVSADADEPLRPPPSFTTRAARALSFGQRHNRNGSIGNNAPPIPAIPIKSHSPPRRDRATTTSSYASTAKPEANLTLGTEFGGDFGGDFGSMFDSPNDKSLPPPPPVAAFHRTVRTKLIHRGEGLANMQQESEPMFPPRTHSRQTFKELPAELKNLRDDAGSPYSWDGRNSNEGLMSSSALSSPRTDGPPPPPTHRTGIAPAFLGKANPGYSLVPDRYSPGLERLSQDSQTQFMGEDDRERDDGYDSRSSQADEEDGWAERVELQGQPQSKSASSFSSTIRSAPPTRKPLGMPPQATAGASRSGAMSSDGSEEGGSLWGAESRNTTPRAAKLELPRHDEGGSMFDSSPVGPSSRAIKPQHVRTQSGNPKKMTKAQFERFQRSESSADQSEEEENSADEYDDEDDAERVKHVAKQRRKQEANMAVYRQQMKKVTGGGPSDLPSTVPRPSLDRTAASAPAVSLHLGGMNGTPPADAVRGRQTDVEDDDVPLGILQAHGFPGANRPPIRQGENDTSQRRASAAGSVVGGGAGPGSLPPFARRLPADPYYGSSLVNQANRESLGMTGPPSVYGVPPAAMPQMMPQQPQFGHPGGLVGVIAGEERAKAARRGSPNPATGTFGTGMPLPTNMSQMSGMPGMPGMPRTMSMGSMALPQTYMPSGVGMMGQMPGQMPMMPQMHQQMPSPGQQNSDQMQQFMQMQMQFMQSMLTMQQQQMGQQTPPAQLPPQQAQDYLGVPMPGKRTSVAPSIRSQAPPLQGRAMTMMHPPTRWDVSPGAQRPNSAMPTTYAPSGMNMGNGLGPGYSPSIAPSERSNVGQPSRYRPITTGNDGSGRSQSMTSSLTLQALGNRQPSPETPVPAIRQQSQSKSTIRMIDKQRGTPKVMTKPVAADEDDEEGWAEMRKKREDKKRFRFGRKDKDAGNTLSLEELYHALD